MTLLFEGCFEGLKRTDVLSNRSKIVLIDWAMTEASGLFAEGSDISAGGPIYRRIYGRIRTAILSGELAGGTRLPSARSLAGQLGLARGTVEVAYQLLAGEGYVATRGAAGTFVESTLAVAPSALRRTERLPAALAPADLAVPPRGETRLRLRMGVPALDAFPRKLWARLVARTARALTVGDLDYPSPAGLLELRHRLAAYLPIARGIACTAEQIFVTSGYQGGLALIARAVLQPGDAVWVEDPGYPFGRDALALAGASIVAVPVDRRGIDVASGQARAPAARLAVVTPCHHYPSGAMLPAPRRLALLDWAAGAGAWIVEDDYDSELRYRGRPLPALKSIDRQQRVIYAGTFSKVLFPALRMGYLVVPDSLLPRFRAAAFAFQPAPSAITQAAVAELIAAGHFARHIRRMRQLYMERRAALVAALGRRCAGRIVLETPAGGMHLIARLQPAGDERAVLARAAKRNLWPAPLSACSVDGIGAAGLLIGFTNVPQSQADAVACQLREALDG